MVLPSVLAVAVAVVVLVQVLVPLLRPCVLMSMAPDFSEMVFCSGPDRLQNVYVVSPILKLLPDTPGKDSLSTQRPDICILPVLGCGRCGPWVVCVCNQDNPESSAAVQTSWQLEKSCS